MASARHLLGLSLLALLAACREQSGGTPADNAPTAAPEVVTPPVTLPRVEEPLNRRDILLAVAEAASAFGLGRDDSVQQRKLDGKPFTFRIRLCENAGDNLMSSFDPETRVLRVKVRPNLTGAAEPATTETEAGKEPSPPLEGFWVPRPWLLEPGCPVRAAQPAGAAQPVAADAKDSGAAQAPPPSARTVGIAHAAGEPGARSVRRGDRPYAITKTLDEGVEPGPVDLVLQGRLKSDPGRKVIQCEAGSGDAAPTCIVSAQIDLVRLETRTGELLGEWSEG